MTTLRLPRGVVLVETRLDSAFSLTKLELRSIGKVAPRRLEDFRRGRWCAHQALRLIGAETSSIPRCPTGSPTWPTDVVGAITHCYGYAAAVVSLGGGQVHGLGIDAEPNEPLTLSALRQIATSDEIADLPTDPDWPIHPDRLLFSAKECAFKALASAGMAANGFESIRITWKKAQTFHARARGSESVQIEGIYCRRGRTIVTVAVAISRQQPAELRGPGIWTRCKRIRADPELRRGSGYRSWAV